MKGNKVILMKNSEERHFYGKELTFPIESRNSDIRHHLARFTRNLQMIQDFPSFAV